jgi:hypothetical protein
MYDFSENLQEWARRWHDRNVEAISSFGVRSPYRPGVTSGQALRQIDRPTLPGIGPAERRFSSGAVRVLPCAALLPVSLLFVVALTGIEPNGWQFISFQFGLSVCKHVHLVSPGRSRRRYRSATLSLGCHSASPGLGCIMKEQNCDRSLSEDGWSW